MNLWEALAQSGPLCLVVLVLGCFMVLVAGLCIATLIRHIVRHLNIRKHGWPPPHCDADGDPVTDDDETQ